KIDRRGLVGFCLVIDAKLILIVQRVRHANRELARKTLFAIGAAVPERDALLLASLKRETIPNDFVETAHAAAVQCVDFVVVLFQHVLFSVERKFTARDPIGYPAYGGAKITVALR